MAFQQNNGTGLRLGDNADLEFGDAPDITMVSNGTDVTVTGAGTVRWADDIFIVASDGDPTARMRIEAGGITGGQTRVLTMNDADVSLLLTPGNQVIADPGNGGAILVTTSGSCAMTSVGADETRTIAVPAAVGQRISLFHSVDGGNITVTSSEVINQAANTKMIFTDVADFIELVCVDLGGGPRWRVVSNDGVALS